MNKQNYKTKVLQIIVFAFAILITQSTANAQTALEQQCFNAVQGKVAWNQAGNTSWGEGNIRNLCKGTTNPSATIACFQAQIKQHGEWSRGIAACLPKQSPGNLPSKIQEEKVAVPLPIQPETVRTVTFKNNANIQATFAVGTASSGLLNIGESKTVNIKEGMGTPLQIVVAMKLPNPLNFEIYRGTISGDNRATNFCFEAKGDVAKPSVQPCNGTQVTEAKKVEFRNEAGFFAKPTLNYFVNGSPKSISSEDTSLGMNRIFYLPTNADKDKDITLLVNNVGITGRYNWQEIKIDRNSGSSVCYKIWGDYNTPKINPCSLSASARTIKFKNNGAFVARLTVVFDPPNIVVTNTTKLLESDVQEIPRTTTGKPIEVFIELDEASSWKKFYTTTVPANFTGEVCFKTEGTAINPNASTCDDELNVTRDVDSRQIIFKNEAGYDAQISVMYFEMQNIGGTKVPMPKTVASGFINLGKSRTITIPKDIAPNQITIILQGNATVKNNIWSTTLPADFKSSPVPCFKTWGSLFDPQGGKCN